MLSKSKLIRQLKILSPEEFKNLEKWLKSPWCNSNKTLIKFYKLLRRHYPAFDSPQLSKEKIFNKIYPAKPYNSPWMHNLTSEFFKQVENFQVHEQIRRDDRQSTLNLTEILLRRNRPDLFRKKSMELIDDLEQKANKDLDDFYQLIFLYEGLYHNPDFGEEQDATFKALGKFNAYLDRFYSLGKSRFFIEAIEGKQNFEQEYELNEQEQLAYLEKLAAGLSSASLNTYQIYFQHRRQPSKDWFAQLEQAFFKNFHNFHKKDQKILLTLLINENARSLRTGNNQSAFFEKAFELYEMGLEHELLLDNGSMRVTTFVNIVATGNFLKKIAFSTRFIEKYYPLLDSEIREDVYNWAKIHLAFNTGDPQLWTMAKKMVQRKSSDNRFAIRARILLIQMWVEDFVRGKEKDVQFVLDLCQAFERQLDRSRFLPTTHTEAFKKFVQYARRLIHSVEKDRPTPEKISGLERSVSAEKNLHGKAWLLRKIEGFK